MNWRRRALPSASTTRWPSSPAKKMNKMLSRSTANSSPSIKSKVLTREFLFHASARIKFEFYIFDFLNLHINFVNKIF